MMTKFLTLIMVASLSACLSPDQITRSQEREMIELDAMIKKQAVSISTLVIDKTVTLDGVSDESQFVYDSVLISKDLEEILDLSFADLVQSSNYDKTLNDENLKVFYTRKENEKYGPLIIKLQMEATGEIFGVELELAEDNYLYQSHKYIKLAFAENRLSQYSIEGFQKLIGMDSSSYAIKAVVRVKK